MIFTNETPKAAGAYWWKKHQDSAPYLCDLSIEPDGDLLLKVAGQFGYQDEIRKGGLWCLLVPHDEVEKAYREGNNNGWHNALNRDPRDDFPSSRAFRVAKGEEK
jgi:hypothetical protein